MFRRRACGPPSYLRASRVESVWLHHIVRLAAMARRQDVLHANDYCCGRSNVPTYHTVDILHEEFGIICEMNST